ncbi:MAG: thiaminase II [Proteobacteria bacterium]|nr:thiaminase II [Pseudomonadota bacterium]MBI3499521.1 thiaminase II [Pseudomonadota bacterium]
MSTGLFGALRAAAKEEWRRYVEHPFVAELGKGSLPERCFRHYLGQDYLFLIHFARAWALAVYKSSDLAEMRQALASLNGILEVEMGLHVQFCRGWGLSEAEMAALPEADATMAYTRYVLERGLAGDLLDLEVALAPCIIGYAEIGRRLRAEAGGSLAGNPYRAWIEMYAGKEYQAVAAAAEAELDRLWQARAGGGRLAPLTETFTRATRLEAAFWQMGWEA